MQTCVTCVWPEHHSNVSALTAAHSTSQMSHIFKACCLQAVTSRCLSKSCLLTLMMTACKTFFLLDFQINQPSSNVCHVFQAAPPHFWDLLHMDLLFSMQQHRGKKRKAQTFFLVSCQFIENETCNLKNQTFANGGLSPATDQIKIRSRNLEG